MARSVGESVSSVLERIFESSDSEVYSPSVRLEGGGAVISDDEYSDVEPLKKKTRKRLKTPESWKKNKRKRRRNSGKKLQVPW